MGPASRATLAELIEALLKAEREGRLADKIRFHARPSLLIVDEIGYLPITQGGANLFFQLLNARYEKGAMILTSNRGFAEWADVLGDTVFATAPLLDRLLRHAVVVQIEGASYRLPRSQRSYPGTHAHKCANHTAASAKAPRSPAKERSCKSLNLLTTEPAKLGKFDLPVVRKFEMPVTQGGMVPR